MGVCIQPDVLNMSYTSYATWINELCRAAGYSTRPSVIDENPLSILLTHADHEGSISVLNTMQIIPVLVSLLPKLDGRWKISTEIFIDRAERSVTNNEALRYM